MGLVLWNMDLVALGTLHRKAGYGDCLAPPRIPPVLDVEGPPRATRTTCSAEGDPKTDSANEPREPTLGRSAHPRELLKLGIDIGETSVGKYMVRHRSPPSQTWRTFLENHIKSMVSVDFFTVPTLRFQVLYVFLVLAHDRRRIVHFNVTAHPTTERTAQQLREAFPFEQVPKYLLRDRDGIFGADFTKQVEDLRIEQVLSGPRAPWQRAYIERVIGSIRRECLDQVIVFNEGSLYRHVQSFVDYYHESRTHLSLEKDTPVGRPVQPPEAGRVIAVPQIGGLHHRYERRAA
jgi:transposase InsO family protein